MTFIFRIYVFLACVEVELFQVKISSMQTCKTHRQNVRPQQKSSLVNKYSRTSRKIRHPHPPGRTILPEYSVTTREKLSLSVVRLIIVLGANAVLLLAPPYRDAGSPSVVSTVPPLDFSQENSTVRKNPWLWTMAPAYLYSFI